MFRVLRNDKDCIYLQIFFFAKLQPDLSGNPFFVAGKRLGKKKIGNGRRKKLPKKLRFLN